MKKEYPVGAKWSAVNQGRKGEIWLAKRENGIEIWAWSLSYYDGSGRQAGWNSSYDQCKKDLNNLAFYPMRFLRTYPEQLRIHGKPSKGKT